MIRVTGLAAVLGLLLVVFGGSLAAAMAGAALWGAGVALGFPVGMSAAADDPRHSAGRVSVVSSIGYLAFLAGPPFVGFLGHEVGTLRALTAAAGARHARRAALGGPASGGPESGRGIRLLTRRPQLATPPLDQRGRELDPP